MVESALNVAAEQLVEWSAYGNLMQREGNRSPQAAPQGLYSCADGEPGAEKWLALSVASDAQWRALRKALGTQVKVEARFGSAALPLSLVATGAVTALCVPLWDDVPTLFLVAGSRVTSWAGREWVRAGVAFLVLVLPTTFMGLTFPLAAWLLDLERETHVG